MIPGVSLVVIILQVSALYYAPFSYFAFKDHNTVFSFFFFFFFFFLKKKIPS